MRDQTTRETLVIAWYDHEDFVRIQRINSRGAHEDILISRGDHLAVEAIGRAPTVNIYKKPA